MAANLLIGVGIILLFTGLLLKLGLNLKWLGRLPGDVVLRRQNFTFYFPLTTSLLLSLFLSLVLFILMRILGRR